MATKIRVSDYIVKFLEQTGIDTVFLLSGGGMMHLLDAVGKSNKIKTVSQHHEQCCGFAADGYARIKNNLGVAFATSGPGALNLVTAICSSYQDSTPTLFFTGQSKLQHTIQYTKIKNLRQFGTFEADIVPITKSITKNSTMLMKAVDIRYELEKAYHLATSGRPGPCVIDLPVDLQGALIDEAELHAYTPEEITPKPVENKLDSMLAQFQKSKRPLIIAGHGVRVSNTSEQLKSFSQNLKIPIVTTGMGTDLIEYDHDSLVGHVGVKGDRAGNIAVQNSDFILCLGTSLPAMVTGYEIPMFAPHAYKVLVDPDPATHEKQEVKIDLKVELTVEDFFIAVKDKVQNLKYAESESWIRLCKKSKDELKVESEPHNKTGDKMNYYEVIESLNLISEPGDVFVTDAGLPFYLMGQAYKPKNAQRMIVSGALGQMGYALPATTGVCFGAPEKRVICITGDGSLQTNIHELSVMRYHNLNAKIIVVNNNGYVSIRNTQNNYFNGLLVGTDPEHGVPLPDLSLHCKSIGLEYVLIKNRNDLKQNFANSLKQKGPVLIEIIARPDQEVIPTVSSQKMPDGKMVSKPIHDMYPFMNPEKLKEYLIKG